MNKVATPKHFEGFIFDLDGTLLNTLPDLVVVTNKALEKEGFPSHSEADILHFVGDGVMSLVLQAIPEYASEDQAKNVYENFRSMYAEYGLSLTEQFDGMPESLHELKRRGKKLGIMSNKFEGGVNRFSTIPGKNIRFPGFFSELPKSNLLASRHKQDVSKSVYYLEVGASRCTKAT